MLSVSLVNPTYNPKWHSMLHVLLFCFPSSEHAQRTKNKAQPRASKRSFHTQPLVEVAYNVSAFPTYKLPKMYANWQNWLSFCCYVNLLGNTLIVSQLLSSLLSMTLFFKNTWLETMRFPYHITNWGLRSNKSVASKCTFLWKGMEKQCKRTIIFCTSKFLIILLYLGSIECSLMILTYYNFALFKCCDRAQDG